jgi:hypothetical protein
MGDKETVDPHAEILSSLRSKYGTIAHFTDSKTAQLFAFRTPSLDEWESFEERMKKGERIGPAKRELCQLTLVHPDSDDGVARLKKVFERAPRVATLIGDELMLMAEGDVEVTIKKD